MPAAQRGCSRAPASQRTVPSTHFLDGSVARGPSAPAISPLRTQPEAAARNARGFLVTDSWLPRVIVASRSQQNPNPRRRACRQCQYPTKREHQINEGPTKAPGSGVGLGEVCPPSSGGGQARRGSRAKRHRANPDLNASRGDRGARNSQKLAAVISGQQRHGYGWFLFTVLLCDGFLSRVNANVTFQQENIKTLKPGAWLMPRGLMVPAVGGGAGLWGQGFLTGQPVGMERPHRADLFGLQVLSQVGEKNHRRKDGAEGSTAPRTAQEESPLPGGPAWRPGRSLTVNPLCTPT